MTSARLPPSARGGVEDAGGEQGGGEAGDESELRESEQPDPDHLAGEQVARSRRREDQFDDAVVLLLDHAGDDPLAVDRERQKQEQGAGIRDQGLGVGGLLVWGMERRRRQLRCRWQVVAERAHGRVCDRRRLRIDVRAKDKAVAGQEQERIDLLGFERLPSGRCRGDDAQPYLRVVEGCCRALERRQKPGRRRRGHRDPVRRLLRERPVQGRRPADEEEQHQC